MEAIEGGPDGMNFIEILLKLSAKYLKPNGSLWIECDPNHPEIIKKITEKNYNQWRLKFISSNKDYSKKERFVEIKKE